MPETQSYENHRRSEWKFSRVGGPAILLAAVGAITYAVMVLVGDATWRERVLAATVLVLSGGMIPLAICIRIYPLQVQDRVIALEVALRYQRLTGKSFHELEAKLTKAQVVALRFAGDAELAALCDRALAENMTPDAIKRAVKEWRADNRRV